MSEEVEVTLPEDSGVDPRVAEIEAKLKEKGIEIPPAEPVSNAEVDPVEAEARKKGWDPSKGSKTAQQFLDAEPYLEEIKSRGKQLKELEKKLDAITQHLDVERRKGYNQALEDLKRQRSDAIALGDEQSVNEIENRIRETEKVVPIVEEKSPYETPVVLDFREQNKDWLNDYRDLEHAEMNRFFVERCNQLELAGITNPEEAVTIVNADLKKKFSNYFNKSENSSGYSPTVSDSNPTGIIHNKKKFSFKDLNEQQKTACRYLTRKGTMSEEDYIRTLVEAGDLK